MISVRITITHNTHALTSSSSRSLFLLLLLLFSSSSACLDSFFSAHDDRPGQTLRGKRNRGKRCREFHVTAHTLHATCSLPLTNTRSIDRSFSSSSLNPVLRLSPIATPPFNHATRTHTEEGCGRRGVQDLVTPDGAAVEHVLPEKQKSHGKRNISIQTSRCADIPCNQLRLRPSRQPKKTRGEGRSEEAGCGTDLTGRPYIYLHVCIHVCVSSECVCPSQYHEKRNDT